MAFFPRELALVGQWDPETAPANNRRPFSRAILDKDDKPTHMTPEMKKMGPEQTSTDSKTKKYGEEKAVRELRAAINSSKDGGYDMLNDHYPDFGDYVYKYKGSAVPTPQDWST